MKHEHPEKTCDHTTLKWCKDCRIVYCAQCDKTEHEEPKPEAFDPGCGHDFSVI